jgi:hypothetical protein
MNGDIYFFLNRNSQRTTPDIGWFFDTVRDIIEISFTQEFTYAGASAHLDAEASYNCFVEKTPTPYYCLLL